MTNSVTSKMVMGHKKEKSVDITGSMQSLERGGEGKAAKTITPTYR